MRAHLARMLLYASLACLLVGIVGAFALALLALALGAAVALDPDGARGPLATGVARVSREVGGAIGALLLWVFPAGLVFQVVGRMLGRP